MRVRDIVHASGRRLRIGLDRGCADEAVIIQLSDPERIATDPVLLDLYGGELLAGFLMNARLAAPAGELAEEASGGLLGCRHRLTRQAGRPVVELSQGKGTLAVPQPLWDRLYAELMLALVHGRHLEGGRAGGHGNSPLQPALLH